MKELRQDGCRVLALDSVRSFFVLRQLAQNTSSNTNDVLDVRVQQLRKEKEGEFGDDRIKIFDKYKAYAFDIHYDDAKSATNTQGSRGSRGSRGSQGSKITQSSKITRLTKSKNGKFINTNHTYQIYHNYAHLSVTLM